MKTLKVVSRIATFFSIVSFIFVIFSAIVTFELIQVASSGAPIEYIVFYIVSSILPYLFIALLTLVIAMLSKGAADSTPEPEEALPPVEPKA
jgi:hypothetical protein